MSLTDSLNGAGYGGGGNRTREPFPAEPLSYGESPRYVIVRALEERDGTRCFYCEKELSPYRTHIDHVVPTIRKGPNCLDNLVLACQGCNIRKRQLPGWFFLVRQISDEIEREKFREHCRLRAHIPYVVYA